MAPGEFDALCEERRATSKAKPVEALSSVDIELLGSYLKACERIGKKRPDRVMPEEWDEIIPYAREHGRIPQEYEGRVSMRIEIDPETGEQVTHYTDTAYESWLNEFHEAQDKYHDTIVRALRFALGTGENIRHPQVNELIQVLIESFEQAAPAPGDDGVSLLSRAYVPLLNGALTNEFMQLRTRDATPDKFTGAATFETAEGHKYTIEHFDKLQSSLGIAAKKLLDVAVAYLTDGNFYRGRNVSPTVEIPLIEFGEACGYSLTARTMETPEEQAAENKAVANRIKWFRTNVRRDLHDISSVLWTGEEKKGRNRGDYREMRLISSHSIRNGILRINFDIDAATYLVNAYLTYYPVEALLRIRNANAYAIGRKMAVHNGIDNNYGKGTNNTLSVRSLLSAATDLQSYEALRARGQRNWKDKIKRPLEAALDELVSVGLLGKWEYRDPKGTTYTADEAKALSWLQYSRLMVDYVMVDAPDQTERRAAIAEAKAKAAEAKRQGEGRKRRARGSDAGTKG